MGAAPSKDDNTEEKEEDSEVEGRVNHQTHSTTVTQRQADHQLERDILRERFKILNNGEESSPLHVEVFDKEPYYENHFCQRLIGQLFQSSDVISFAEFHDELMRWQDLDENEKLGLMLLVLKFDSNISHNTLWKVLHNSLGPSRYSENECKLLAKATIDTMIDEKDPGKGLSLSQYKRWMTKNIPKEKQKDALCFKISDLN